MFNLCLQFFQSFRSSYENTFFQKVSPYTMHILHVAFSVYLLVSATSEEGKEQKIITALSIPNAVLTVNLLLRQSSKSLKGIFDK